MFRIVRSLAESGHVGPALEHVPFVERKKAKEIYNKLFITSHEVSVKRKAREHNMSILISGPPKSGNTWLRFVIFNYYNIKINGASETLTYDELNEIQKTAIPSEREISENSEIGSFFVRTHKPYYHVYDSFDAVIFVYRNPLDTLISQYRSRSARPTKSNEVSLDEYVLANIDGWIDAFRETKNNSDIIVSYKRRKENPIYEHKRVLNIIDNNINEEFLAKSIKMSSFRNIRKMEDKKNQRHGNYPHEKNALSDNFRFTRSGRLEQYKDELSSESIEKCKNILRNKEVEEYIM